MKKRILLALVLPGMTLTGCASITTPGEDDYQFGATTRTYCEATDPTTREAGRRLAAVAGVTLIDLCGAYDYVRRRGDE